MSREVCIHGVELPHFGPGETSVDVRVCMECLAERGDSLPADRREREELAKECYLSLLCKEHPHNMKSQTLLKYAIEHADVYLQWRDEERRK